MTKTRYAAVYGDHQINIQSDSKKALEAYKVFRDEAERKGDTAALYYRDEDDESNLADWEMGLFTSPDDVRENWELLAESNFAQNTVKVSFIRVHNEDDGWVIDGAHGDKYTEDLWKFDTLEEATSKIPEFIEYLFGLGYDVTEIAGQPKYGYTGWQQDDERPGVYYIEITNPYGEEYATIVHRTRDGKYPLDGPEVTEKEKRAVAIVDALNAER